MHAFIDVMCTYISGKAHNFREEWLFPSFVQGFKVLFAFSGVCTSMIVIQSEKIQENT